MYTLKPPTNQQIIEKDGRPCGCGQRGCWETYASATSVVNRAREALLQEQGQEQQQTSGPLASISPEALTAKDVFDAAYQGGDTLASRIVEEVSVVLRLCGRTDRFTNPTSPIKNIPQ